MMEDTINYILELTFQEEEGKIFFHEIKGWYRSY